MLSGFIFCYFFAINSAINAIITEMIEMFMLKKSFTFSLLWDFETVYPAIKNNPEIAA